MEIPKNAKVQVAFSYVQSLYVSVSWGRAAAKAEGLGSNLTIPPHSATPPSPGLIPAGNSPEPIPLPLRPSGTVHWV